MSGQKIQIDKQALFELVRYQPHAGQVLVHESRARFRVLVCGARWGKSVTAAMEVVAAALEPCEHSLGWCVAPTAELTKFTFERARIALLEHLPHRVLEDDTRSSRIVVKNLGGGTSEIRAKSTDNATSLLGESVDWLILDEASKVRDGVWESYIAPRLVDRKGWALILSTPRSVEDWLFAAWHRGQKGRDKEYESWRFPSTSNPHLDPAVIESERRRLPPAVFEQEFLAHFEGEKSLSCETCGGPSWDVRGVLISLNASKEPRCPSCRKLVDANGRTVWGRRADGSPRLFLISGSADPRSRAEADDDTLT
jgi:hypothetical protein